MITIKIDCRHCGNALAEHDGKTLIYRGALIPLQGLDGITFKCGCGRRREYHLRAVDLRILALGQMIEKGA